MTLTATVSPAAGASGTPTGTVQFEDNGNDIGTPVTLNNSDQAEYTTSSLPSARHDYGGLFGRYEFQWQHFDGFDRERRQPNPGPLE